MRRATSALLIAIVAAFAVAACGGSDDSPPPTKAEYKQTYTALSKELTATGTAVGDALNGTSGKTNKQIAKSFSEVADRVRAVATTFGDANPPDDAAVKTNRAKLVAGLNTVADDLDAISKAAGKNDLKAAGAAAVKLNKDEVLITRPKAALDKALGIPQPKPPTTTTTTEKK